MDGLGGKATSRTQADSVFAQGLPVSFEFHGRLPLAGLSMWRPQAVSTIGVHHSRAPAGIHPTLTSMRRGRASSRRGMLSLSTPSLRLASIFDISKSELNENARAKRGSRISA